MQIKFQSKSFGILLLSLVIGAFTNCSKSDRIPDDPSNTVILNMQNELNGKTFLGGTDVFINKSNNFFMSSHYITDAGEVGGLGVEIIPQFSNLAREAAVIPGHAYQVFDRDILLEFPSGKRAIQQGGPYLQAYVVSPITTGEGITGATVKFFQTASYEESLPEFNSKSGVFFNISDQLELSLPAGSEYVLEEKRYENVEDVFTLSANDGKLYITLIQTPSKISGPYGSYYLRIRQGNVYTRVRVGVLVY